MTKLKDTNYLSLSSRLRAMEKRLLDQSRMERILESASDEEAAKLLQECGYGVTSVSDPAELDRALSEARREVLRDLASAAPDGRFVDLFRMKYDYHNVKVLLKAEAKGVDPGHMLMDLGRIAPDKLREAVETGAVSDLPPRLQTALQEAREVLHTTGDPQLSDIVLDRNYYQELQELARDTGSAFLAGYVRRLIDADNLRALVRTLRMHKGAAFLRQALVEGGDVAVSSILNVAGAEGGGLAELYATTRLHAAAEAGAAAVGGGALTRFEKLCDDAVSNYLADAKYVAFGEAPLVGYLAARETEYTNLRILLLGRSMGLSGETVRERLREAYV